MLERDDGCEVRGM